MKEVYFCASLNKFCCSLCDRFFPPLMDESSREGEPIRWSARHPELKQDGCPLAGKKFEIVVVEVSEVREVGKNMDDGDKQ